MLNVTGLQVYLAVGATDMRKSINTLAMVVEGRMDLNPFSGHLFAFCNRRCDAVKYCIGTAMVFVCGTKGWNKTGSVGRGPKKKC